MTAQQQAGQQYLPGAEFKKLAKEGAELTPETEDEYGAKHRADPDERVALVNSSTDEELRGADQ